MPTDEATTPSAADRSPWEPKRTLLRLLIIVVLTYVGVCGVLFVVQDSLIYFPTSEYGLTPADMGLDYEDVTLNTGDGVSIAAWYTPHARPRGTVLHCHGNARNMSDRVSDVLALHQAGFNVLLFDYRGYGRSEGSPSEMGTYQDAEAAWRFLVEQMGESPERMVIFGRSLGGGVAVELALRHRPVALIVEASFTSLPETAARHYPFLPVRWLCRHRYASIEKVGRIDCPKLFIHARDDELVPFAIGRWLYEAASEPKQFIETPGGHNDGGYLYNEDITKQVQDFLHGVLPARPSDR
jgi:pimeloyl-ACP methyl ester carboxylesterase